MKFLIYGEAERNFWTVYFPKKCSYTKKKKNISIVKPILSLLLKYYKLFTYTYLYIVTSIYY